jgi:hypothetical protein
MEWTEEEERHKSELRKHCFEELDKGKDLTEDDQCLVIAATFGRNRCTAEPRSICQVQLAGPSLPVLPRYCLTSAEGVHLDHRRSEHITHN